MLLALFFLAAMTVSGMGVLRLFRVELNLKEAVPAGLVLGLMLATWTGFIVSLLAGRLLVWPVFGVVLVFSVFILIFFSKGNASDQEKTPADGIFIALIGLAGLFFLLLFSRMIVEDAEGIWAGGRTVWGDWAGHMGYIANWVYGNNLPPENPWYAGVRLAYPFLFDFTSAMLVKSGMTIPRSLEIPGALLSIAMTALIYELARQLTKSREAGALSVFIFILSGGLGFVYLFPDLPAALRGVFPPARQGVTELTHIPEANIRWVNFIISEMIPQRGILVGITGALAVFLFWLKGTTSRKKGCFATAGLLAGLLPFFHAHTFLVLMMVSSVYFLLHPRTEWLYFFFPALLLALPQWLYFLPQVTGYSEGFIRWQPGWLAPAKGDNWLWFWVKNIGVMAVLIPAAWAYFWKHERRLFFYYVPFLLVFAAANLWVFQPWDYDNTKLLRFWYLASSVLVAGALCHWAKQRILRGLVGGLLLVSVILSGAVDAGSCLRFDRNKRLMWTPDQIELARVVRNITPKKSVFLTSDTHNHWVVDLSGRKIVLGYRGWLWSWGIDYREREKDVQAIFLGTSQANVLIAKHKIDYVVIGPREREVFHANADFHHRHHLLILDMNHHLIFKTR
ncbi:MAG: hypothetical protein JRI76_14085 [Deltaproteobacteria bacterium]|nr:hypothetical protein [Deltaproteobacteria bacterium]